MLLHITSDLVLSCEFLADCESGFIRSVMLNLEQRFYSKDQFILDKVTKNNGNPPANGMFFVKSGIVEVSPSARSGREELAVADALPARAKRALTRASGRGCPPPREQSER
jgi:hypothetical protein